MKHITLWLTCLLICALGCVGTRKTLGLGARPWEVQCTAEQYGPKECDEFDGVARFDKFDDIAQMTFKVTAGVDRQRGVIHWSAITNDHHHAALFGPSK